MTTTKSCQLIVVDRKLQDDLLFWPNLARAVASRPPGSSPLVILHAPAERVERALEGAGYELGDPVDLTQMPDRNSAALLARSAREENRYIVGVLSEEGVHAVGFVGDDRRLLTGSDSAAWLAATIDVGAVAVISSIGEMDHQTRAIGLDQSVLRLSEVIGRPLSIIALRTRPRPKDRKTGTRNRPQQGFRPAIEANTAGEPPTFAKNIEWADRLRLQGLSVTETVLSGLSNALRIGSDP